MKNLLFITLISLIHFQSDAQWTEEQKILAQITNPSVIPNPSEQEVNDVAIDGEYALVGVPFADVNGENSGMAVVYRWDGLTWIEEQALIPGDGAASDFFGLSVSISGNIAIVGAKWDDDNGPFSGSAYIFELNDGIWNESAKLIASDGADGDEFGESVSISGSRAIVGVYHDDDNGSASGSAYIFELIGENWVEDSKLTAFDGEVGDLFGNDVSISGTTALVGTQGDDNAGSNSGACYIFELISGTWTFVSKLTASDSNAGDLFGISVSISGGSAIIGAYGNGDNGPYSGSAYIFEQIDGDWEEIAKLTASDGAAYNKFGKSVAISGNIAIIGANQNDEIETTTGSAYIFEFNGSIWIESTKIIISDGSGSDQFGHSVSISGTNIIVGDYGNFDWISYPGSAYIYEKTGDVWTQSSQLIEPEDTIEDEFGYSVSISGSKAIVGAYNDDENGFWSGSAYIFELIDGSWLESAKLIPPDLEASDRFGCSVAISGNTAIVGSGGDNDNGPSSGSAYIYDLIAGSWIQSVKLTASDGEAVDNFGYSVSISDNKVIVGAYKDDDNGDESGSAYIFKQIDGSWTEITKLIASDGTFEDRFGFSVSISNNTAIVGAWGDDENGFLSGSAYIFEQIGGSWTEITKLTASDGVINDRFGSAVSIHGSTAVLGVRGSDPIGSSSGAVYVFELIGENWTETDKLIASDGEADDRFGFSVSISGNTFIAGTYSDDDNGTESGSAYIFEKLGDTWTESAKLTASDGAADDRFGRSVAISSNSAIVGAYLDDDQGSNSGSAYIFSSSVACDQTDLNDDGISNGADFSIFLGNFGLTCDLIPCPTDLNSDGIINGLDFSIFLGNYGLSCD